MLALLTSLFPQDPPAVQLATIDDFDLVATCLRTAAAIATGVVLALVYRGTHKGLSYAQSFTQTIVFVCVIVALVMMTVRNSLATAFTLVGALSIIRFRTVVKDTRDTAFVFAALALGLAAGLGMWPLLALGLVAVCGLALGLYATDFGALYKSEFLVRFTFDQSRDSAAYLARLQEFAKRSNLLHIEPSADGRTLRLSFDVTLHRGKQAEALAAALGRTDGCSEVVLVVSKNDVDY